MRPTCPSIDPKSGVQCGEPEGHPGSGHKNGWNHRWEDVAAHTRIKWDKVEARTHTLGGFPIEEKSSMPDTSVIIRNRETGEELAIVNLKKPETISPSKALAIQAADKIFSLYQNSNYFRGMPRKETVEGWADFFSPATELLDRLYNFTPTAENINALPEPIRKYIHDLETNADPAGMVQENALLSLAVESGLKRIAELEWKPKVQD